MLESTSLATRRQAKHLFVEIANFLPKKMDNLWAESMNWATAALSITATTAKPGKARPYEMYHVRPSTLTLRPFLSPCTYHFQWDRKSEPHGRPGFLLGSSRNYSPDTVRILDGKTQAVVTTRDVFWIEYTPGPALKKDASASSTEQGGDEDDRG